METLQTVFIVLWVDDHLEDSYMEFSEIKW